MSRGSSSEETRPEPKRSSSSTSYHTNTGISSPQYSDTISPRPLTTPTAQNFAPERKSSFSSIAESECLVPCDSCVSHFTLGLSSAVSALFYDTSVAPLSRFCCAALGASQLWSHLQRLLFLFARIFRSFAPFAWPIELPKPAFEEDKLTKRN